MAFFDTLEAYEIAKKVTGGNELYKDLVSHVYLIMRDKKDIDDEAAFFASTAYRQWTLPNSEFNNLYIPYYTTEINDEITEDVRLDLSESKYKKFLRDYLDREPEGESCIEWFKKQIVRFRLMGMTYAEIRERYGINDYLVSKTIKQFTDDVYKDYIGTCDSEDIDNV